MWLTQACDQPRTKKKEGFWKIILKKDNKSNMQNLHKSSPQGQQILKSVFMWKITSLLE